MSGHCRPKLGFNLSLLAHCATGIEKKIWLARDGVLEIGVPVGEACIDT